MNNRKEFFANFYLENAEAYSIKIILGNIFFSLYAKY